MKRFLVLLVLSVMTIAGASSVKAGNFGIVGGASFMHIRNVSVESTTGYHAGITYKFGLPSGFSIQPSLLYHMKASESDAGSYEVDMKVGYVELPVSFQWGPDLLVFRPFLDVSPFIGYGLSQDFEGKKFSDVGDTIVRDSWKSVNRLEYGLGVGGGIEVWKLQLVCRYNWNFGSLVNQDGNVDVNSVLRYGLRDNNFGGVTLSLALLF